METPRDHIPLDHFFSILQLAIFLQKELLFNTHVAVSQDFFTYHEAKTYPQSLKLKPKLLMHCIFSAINSI